MSKTSARAGGRGQRDLRVLLVDDSGMAICLAGLGIAALRPGDGEEKPEPLVEEAVRRAERSGDDFALAVALMARVVATLGYERSEPLARCVPRLQTIGDLVGVAFTCSVTGLLASDVPACRPRGRP